MSSELILGQVEVLLNQLPNCDSLVNGICILEATSGKGKVLYTAFEKCSDSLINLPGINLLPTWLLGVMWALFLVWLFFGVAAVSDVFVEAIEVIASETKKVVRIDTNNKMVEREVPVWNWALSNISLMAIGSSSPEILLALVEAIITLGKPPESLGAATIIGSGAYNLFAISAVCTMSTQIGVLKRIEHIKVFWWTTVWSMWVHLWLWLVYKTISPNEIELWEALFTLAMTPVFMFTTWLVDTRGWNWFGANKNAILPAEDDVESVKGTAPSMTEGYHQKQYRSIMYYRSLAVQKMAGVPGTHHNRLTMSPSMAMKQDDANVNFTVADLDTMGKTTQKVFMKSPDYSVLESMGEARVQVVRMHGDLQSTLRVNYTCKDDTAVAGLDYEHCEGMLVFGPGQEMAEITIKIVDDDMSEPDVTFTVTLTSACIDGGEDVMMMRKNTTVTIVDDDDGGVLVFELPTFEAGVQDEYAEVMVIRRNGADGRVAIDYATKDGSAVAGKHFKQTKGSLVFESGQTRNVIQVPMLPFESPELVAGMLAFRLTLSNPVGGVILGSRCESRVVIVPGKKSKGLTQFGKKDVKGGDDDDDEDGEYNLGKEWKNQFKEAILPEYNEEEGNLWVAIALHYISFTFKLMCACLPPADWKMGYPCLFAALTMLAGLMVVVKEVAQNFGCAIGLSELMTGMSIVALGTSLPDTFAAQYAAINDDYSDAAIGTINGSNTVNILLGLGIPWTLTAIYNKALGIKYEVVAGSLGFSVMIFFILAVVAIGILMVRRRQGGELGATTVKGQRILFAMFISLWFLFLLLAGLFDYQHIPDAGF